MIKKLLRSEQCLRSSHPEVFLWKSVPKICNKFIALQFYWTALRHGCFHVNLLHIFKTPFPKNTSGRLLLVFDASRSSSGPTLNDCLYSGPNNIEKIVDIVIRFRLNYIGILGDIQQAFLNIEISTQHIDFLRFFWYDFHNTDVEEIVWSRF